MQLLGDHHCITFQLHMPKKDERYNACRFWAPAKCTQQSAKNFKVGGCAVDVSLVEFVDSVSAACVASTL
jgi:hypothetical protein